MGNKKQNRQMGRITVKNLLHKRENDQYSEDGKLFASCWVNTGLLSRINKESKHLT